LLSISSSDAETSRMLARQSKIFEQSQLTNHAKLNRSSLMFSIIKIIFINLIKNTRQLIIKDDNTYKRLQQDFLFIGDTLWELADKDDEMIVSGFYFELVKN